MGEILQTWLRMRLGVIIDLSPEVFGHYTRDGRLLAQILHTYDIITSSQLGTIIQTQDPALSRVNLRHLRVWLRFLGIDFNDECIEEISCGKGTTALRLFYKLYLCLESKDRLHFITLQKEREKYVPISKKFEVTTVCEDPPTYVPPKHPLSKGLAEGRDTIEWHASKFPSILQNFKREREKYEVARKHSVVKPVEHYVAETPKASDHKAEESRELDEFARKHRSRGKTPEEYEKQFEKELLNPIEDPSMARAYVDWLKDRSKRSAVATVVKSKMQKFLLSQLWEKMGKEQEREFDEVIAKRVLDQSKYEKQIMTKLCEVRNQKNIMAENQKMVEDLFLAAKEQECRADVEREKELALKESKDVEGECRRLCELHHRLHEEKIRKLRKKHHKLCLEALQDLIDIAVKAAGYRLANDGYVPSTIWSEWRALFLKSQPIFDETPIRIPEIKDDDDDDDEGEEKEWDEDSDFDDLERIEAMRDVAFDDYHELNSPWDEFIPLLDEDSEEFLDLGSRVLGYIVHRLLEFLYPYPVTRMLNPVERLSTSAIILGLRNSTQLEQFGALLDKSKIRLVRMEDAINYCLQQYKNEMKDTEYIDLNIIAATNEIVRVLQGESRSQMECAKKALSGRSKGSKRSNLRGSSSRTKTKDSEGKGSKATGEKRTKGSEGKDIKLETEDKQTQTPRTIPYDDLDPSLSDAAYIGKWAYEFLTLGQPISNELATKILVEYLKSFNGAKGWALIGYPTTYDQMACLELAVSGQKLPPDPKVVNFEDINIEDIDCVPPRIVFEEQDVDVFTFQRQSKLLPNPIIREEYSLSVSNLATVYIKLAQKPKNFDFNGQSYEVLPENASSIDKFYADQKIAYVLYYTAIDITTLKQLVRLVVGERLRRKSSEDLFGDVLKDLERGSTRVSGSKAPVVRRLLSNAEENFEVDMSEEEEGGEGQEKEEEEGTQFDPRPAKPGERNWMWIDFPLSAAIQETLARLWESLENVYVEDLRENFLLKCIHSSAVVPYKDFVTRNVKDFIERPDDKQNYLYDFHCAFNAIDEDARDDPDVKCELHRRVADFQSQLWEICDRRRIESEEERRRLINERWTVIEAKVLFNVYIGILQAEMDRCVDTLRIIQDYYMEMLRKPLQDIGYQKAVLNKIELDAEHPIELQDQLALGRLTDRKDTRERSRGKVGSPRSIPIPPAVDRSVLEKEIADLLIDSNKKSFDPVESSIYKTIMDNVRYVRSVADSVFMSANELLKREEAAAHRGEAKIKEPADESLDPGAGNMARRGKDLVLEWRYAIMFEISRIRLRLDLLTAAARSDVVFLLDTMRNTFHRIYDSIIERYWREMKSVNQMANVFCFAIEEERAIEKEMLLDGDQFIIRSSVLMMEEIPEIPKTVKEVATPFRFRMVQLSRLMEIFRRVTPHGILTERSLVYILQDLASHGKEEGETMSLPCSWLELRSCDIAYLVDRLFGPEAYVDWREFVVYAMELPMPNYREILTARDRFRAQDPELREIVSREQYDRTPLWFFESTETMLDTHQVLRDDFQRSRNELYEEELAFVNGDKDDTSGRKESPRRKRRQNSQSRMSQLSAEETMRLTLAKELLSRMFLTSRHTVNYTALLLTFCKDEDPREGLGKALALAIGNRVCTDVDEGEKYVKELLEEKRRAREAEMSRSHLHREAVQNAQDILNSLLNRIGRRISMDEFEDLSDRPRVMIESLDEKLLIDPADLLQEQVTSDHLVIHTDSTSTSEDEHGEISGSISLMRPESDDQSYHEFVVHWLPREVCLAVLAAALPWHSAQPDLFQTSKSLREGLDLAYEELKDEDLSDEEDVVLAHRFVNHSFITLLLKSTNKFTAKHMGSMLQEILQERQNVKST